MLPPAVSGVSATPLPQVAFLRSNVTL